MIEELRPLTLRAAAKQLGVDLFEVVRLMVADGRATAAEPLGFTPDRIDALRVLGGIEASWWDAIDLPDDPHPDRQRVRAAVHALLSRGHVGLDQATRMDNVWRGLPDDAQALLQRALAQLGEEGVLAIVSTRLGVRVAVAEDRVETARAIASGLHDTPGLSALYQE